MTEEIAFADWSKKIERSGNSNDLSDETKSNAEQSTNSWLPAYGFYQPSSTLLQNNKNLEFYSSDMAEVNCTSNLLLETIMEETSDDLRSETSESEYNCGLLTDSVSTVIHVPSYREGHRYKNSRGSYWSNKKKHEINTDPGVQDDDDDDDYENDFTDDGEEQSSATENESDEDIEPVASIETFPSSRTNSLLQFENLEKHYENIFHSQRIVPSENDNFGAPNSFAKRNSRLWAFKSNSQPENLNNLRDIDDDNDSSSLSSSCSSSSSEMISSDEILSSSYSSMRHDSLTTKRSLRSSRSMDSLTSLLPKHENDQTLLHSSEFSQSLNDDMSKLHERKDDVPAPTTCIYKTVECLSELSDNNTYRDIPANASVKKENVGVDEPDRVGTRRSVENLSEDSGFGDHVIARNGNQEDLVGNNVPCTAISITATVPATAAPISTSAVVVTTTAPTSTATTPIVVSENDTGKSQNEERTKIDSVSVWRGYEEGDVCSKFSPNVWQSDPHLLDTTFVIRSNNESDVETIARNDDECYSDPIRVAPVSHQHSEDSSSVSMASRMAVASTPNLYNITDEEYTYKRAKNVTDSTLSNCNDSTVSLSRIYSLKRINFENESKLSCSSSKGSNIQIMTSFVNLTNPHAESNKGVHFCPVVSEVSWQDSYSSESEENFHRVTNNSAAEDDHESYGSTFGGEERCYPYDDRELTPHIDELVEKLLSESVSARRASVGDKENVEQRVQSIRLDLITSPPPDRGGSGNSSGGNHVTHADRESDVNNSWSQLSSSTASSQFSTAFGDAFDRSMISDTSMGDSDAAASPNKAKSKSSVGKLGGFFQRFSLKRLSGRKNKSKKSDPPVVVGCVPKNSYSSAGCGNGRSDSYIVPLSDSGSGIQSMVVTSNEMVSSSSKPPLPPFAPARRRPSAGENVDPAPPPSFVHAAAVEQQYSRQRDGSSGTPTMLRKTPYIDPNTGIGLLETDIDSNVTLAQNVNVNNNGHNNCANDGNSSNNKKSRSLLNLDNGRMSTKQLTPTSNRTKNGSPHHTCNDYRAKSMEFLLDKENQAAVQAPENELQKGSGERKMSEHELRVQRSLQKLNVPEWYRNSSVPAQGFLLKRHSDAGQNQQTHHHRWNASTLPSKTTSLSSLGSNLSTTPRSPTSTVTSPGPSQYSFSRWSTSRLNSGANSASTSPCGSARSSFNHRQPYLGWRSQEKLSKPRTPAERLAAGLLPQNNQIGSQQSSPSLTEVRSSIKEVTSAIVHYVSGTRDSSDRLSPSLRCNDNSSKSASPKGSIGRLCWVESSFVGNRPSNASSEYKQVYAGRQLMADKTSEDSDYQISDGSEKSRCEKESYNNRMNGISDIGMTIKTLVDKYEYERTITDTNFNEWASTVTPKAETTLLTSNVCTVNRPTITTTTISPTRTDTNTSTTNNTEIRLKDYTTLNPDTATLDDILDSLLGLSPSAGTPSSGKVSTESVVITSPGSGGNHSCRSYDNHDNIDILQN